ncbi:MAG: RAD55 family ATPase [Methanomassiliicoccales archaeon]|jgi:KaiC/GvpD/RAD55 family RecA-like ATPase|nr:RAD55 family ATPase [Methanomassiliicoccales archaeon]
MKFTSIGIPALDEHIGGGIQKGSTVLVTGSPGSGTEFFAKQFASAGQELVTYFTSTERDEDVLSVMREYGWRTDLSIVNIGSRYYEGVLAKKLEISRYRQEGISLSDIRRFKESETKKEENLLTFLSYEISKLTPPFRVVINSLDFFLENYDSAEVLMSMRTIKAHTQHSESVTLMTMLKGVHESRIQSSVEDLADVILELDREKVGHEFKKFLIVQKVRNRPSMVGIIPCIFDKTGIRPGQ